MSPKLKGNAIPPGTWHRRGARRPGNSPEGAAAVKAELDGLTVQQHRCRSCGMGLHRLLVEAGQPWHDGDCAPDDPALEEALRRATAAAPLPRAARRPEHAHQGQHGRHGPRGDVSWWRCLWVDGPCSLAGAVQWAKKGEQERALLEHCWEEHVDRWRAER